MDNWILLTILYAIFLSLFEATKKKAIEKNSIYEVLALFSLIAFFLVLFITRDAFKINYIFLPIIFFKSSIIVIAWILGLKALDGISISKYGIIKTSKIIFSVLLSMLIVGEKITIITLLGMSIVILGLILVSRTTDNEENKKSSTKLIIFLLISCLLNSISAIIDKKILFHIASSQLQFWLLLFLTVYYWAILIIKRKKIDFNKIKKNYCIPLIAICLVVGDRLLFIANDNSNSQVIIMTRLKQLSVIISILLGKLLFAEKDIMKKLLYSILIIIGIIVIVCF